MSNIFYGGDFFETLFETLKKKALKSALFSTYPKKNTSFIKPKSKTLEASL